MKDISSLFYSQFAKERGNKKFRDTGHTVGQTFGFTSAFAHVLRIR